MNIVRAIRQLRRSIGLEPARLTDYAIPAAGILAVGLLAGAGISARVSCSKKGAPVRTSRATPHRLRHSPAADANRRGATEKPGKVRPT
jgi:hypothetical protein